MKIEEYIANNSLASYLINLIKRGLYYSPNKTLCEYLGTIEVEPTTKPSELFKKLGMQYSEANDSSLFLRDNLESHNLMAILCLTSSYLQDLDISIGDDVDQEWCSLFCDLSGRCNSPEIQDVWARLLAKELESPHKFFKRTLAVLSKMEPFEIDWFKRICVYSLSNAYVPSFILDDNEFFRFNQFQSLEDCGLINSSLGGIMFDKDEVLHNNTVSIKIDTINSKTNLRIYSFTDAGAQLSELFDVAPDEKFLIQLKKVLERNNCMSVSIDRPL